MSDTPSLTVWQYLVSRDAILTIILPIIIYNIAFWQWGAGAALLITAIYSGVLQYISRWKGYLPIIALILVSGLSHYLYLEGYMLFDIKQESVFLSVSGAMSTVIIFSIYSMLGRPVIQTLAEQATPRLKTLPNYGTPRYTKIWNEVSLVWILAYLIKAIVIYTLSHRPGLPMDTLVLISGWPLTLLLVIFSFKWPKYRWSSHARDNAA
ncbi:hypothetical protein [Pectobacterium zantedeschiae]|uniref:Intracellular septation protein A n=1 Tax=Pectobacterium zantedeschiae TaxID=2034769 RepID=A0A9X8P6T5_9GAMM|nr:hypothetical protein [Pectobacterium zantedeschiae]RYC37322.1 hypothetical protein CTN06_20670 [Pectobacterium zantedeschiae]RYC42570.1 hypothetical protein CTN06_14710 [Pectobacterium zantedeschiae]RYC45808.1 hypothetical protein CLR69_12840 [Pectobacterium zantedeschiae]RYC47136.1 hypothetical protein DEH81_01745 [Pectobacterium zantedeschiae]